MRLAYLGTPAAAVPTLQALVAAGHTVEVVVTQPDRKRGRGAGLVPSPVKAAAIELGISDICDDVDSVLDRGLDLGVVVAFGKLVKPHVLAALPMVNLHFSLLPRWRGAAPVERAVLAGDTETGVCLMALDEGLDTGGIYEEARTTIGHDESVVDLRDRLVGIGTEVIVRRLAGGFASLGDAVPQLGVPTYAKKVDPAELALDWSQPGAMCHAQTRLGRAWTTFRGKRLLIHRASLSPSASAPVGCLDGLVVSCGDATGLKLVEVQPEGKPAMSATAWRNGAQAKVHELFGR